MLKLTLASLALMTGAAQADAPKVVADIAPVHSLVARVMQGIAEPALIMPAGASPHNYAMRPSEARALQQADVVFWVGEDLTPWLERSVDTLAKGAISVELLHAEGGLLLPMRETAVFAADNDPDDAHGEDAHHDGEHEEHHDDHKDEDAHDAHDEHDDHADHAEEGAHEDEHDHHDHDGDDPHVWLAPENAKIWLGLIAETLSDIDPNNAEMYSVNAAAAVSELDGLTKRMRADLAPYAATPFVVFHDAYQYFETSVGLQASGALQFSDASKPSAARLREIQHEIDEHGIQCVFAEPQYNDSIIHAVAPDDVKIGLLDPLGVALAAGPTLYPNLLNAMAQSFKDCLK
ncbi:MAG: zinc ABC transporter substrate-binding protein [Cognatishimia sp.]